LFEASHEKNGSNYQTTTVVFGSNDVVFSGNVPSNMQWQTVAEGKAKDKRECKR
jgi:hypothetical protein